MQLDTDVEEVISDPKIPWEKLSDKCVIVTGATGLIGSLLLRALVFLDERKKLNLRIVGVTRNIEYAKTRLSNISSKITLTTLKSLSVVTAADFIIHTAAPTDSQSFVTRPVEVINDIYQDVFFLLSFCKSRSVTSFVQLSTMEIYGQSDGKEVSEDCPGILNSFSLRASYPEAKRVTETLCKAFFEEYEVPCKVARLTQCFGAGVNLDEDRRVFADFAQKASRGLPIVMHTYGDTYRSYIYTSDAIRAIFFILLVGRDGEVYNVANSSTYCSIRQMADNLSNLCNTTVQVRLDAEAAKKYCKTNKINLDTSKLEELGWVPKISLAESFQRMIRGYNEIMTKM